MGKVSAVLTLVAASTALAPAAGAEDFGARSWEPVVVRGQTVSALAGTPTDQILVYAWRDGQFVQIPHQVDHKIDRVLAGKGDTSFYSGTDLENTYDYDHTETNGLDADDEIAFMVRDLGGKAPDDATVPGAQRSYTLDVTDPQTGATGTAYLFTSATVPRNFAPYTSYTSAVDDIPYNTARGQSLDDTVTTTGYKMHFSTRWALDEIRPRIGPDAFGADLVDRWKGRAFYEEGDPAGGQSEDYWSRSQSQMLGSIAGPVRVIRESLGTNSGTNVTRTVIAYANSFRQIIGLRVHPIPPQGLWGYWDMNSHAGPMTYYSPQVPDGVPVDGHPDSVGTGAEVTSQLGYWQQVSGAQGGIADFLRSQKPVRAISRVHYRDDLSFNDHSGDDPAPGAGQGAYGSFGLNFVWADDTDGAFVQQLGPVSEGVITDTVRVLGPNSPVVGQQLADSQDNPLVVAASRPGSSAQQEELNGVVYALGDGSAPCVPGQMPVEGGACYPISKDPVGTAMPPDNLCPVGLVTGAINGPCGRDLPHPPPPPRRRAG